MSGDFAELDEEVKHFTGLMRQLGIFRLKFPTGFELELGLEPVAPAKNEPETEVPGHGIKPEPKRGSDGLTREEQIERYGAPADVF